MKIIDTCKKCVSETGILTSCIREIEFDDDFHSKHTCENGHTTVMIIDNLKFEHLFDSGVRAYIDGYKIESISTISSSLERFYEFYIQIILEKNDIKYEVFKKNWSHVQNQSERQFGAFLFLYLLEHKENSPIIDDVKPDIEGLSKSKTKGWKSFRNSVIHKGYIPTKNESYAYIELIYNYIHKLLISLFENYREEISKVILNNRKKVKDIDKKIFNTYLDVGRVIGLSSFDKNHTFKEKFDKAVEWRNRIRDLEKT